jgi:hypothetical protein
MAAGVPQCQLLTGTGDVSPEFDGFVKDTGLATWGLDYQARAPGAAAHACEADACLCAQMVAIMGPQSSGKSTLLNHLFGTKFREMDAMAYRGQTTQARLRSAQGLPALACRLAGRSSRALRPRLARLTVPRCRACGWRSPARAPRACARWF